MAEATETKTAGELADEMDGWKIGKEDDVSQLFINALDNAQNHILSAKDSFESGEAHWKFLAHVNVARHDLDQAIRLVNAVEIICAGQIRIKKKE
jgi:hypothetical protein